MSEIGVLETATAGAILFALLAACFWLTSSLQRLPKKLTIGFGGSGGSIQDLGVSLRRQAIYSAFAAISAALSAICQAASLMI